MDEEFWGDRPWEKHAHNSLNVHDEVVKLIPMIIENWALQEVNIDGGAYILLHLLEL